MNETMFRNMINNYIDNALGYEDRTAFEQHLPECSACRDELEALLALQYKIVSLPKSMQPQRDLWSRIESSIQPELQPVENAFEQRKNSKAKVWQLTPRLSAFQFSLRVAAVVLVLAAAGVVWFMLQSSEQPQITSAERIQQLPSSNEMEITSQKNLAEIPGITNEHQFIADAVSEQQRTTEKNIGTPKQKNKILAVSNESLNEASELEKLEERLQRGLQLSTAPLSPANAGKIVGYVSNEQGKPVGGMTVEIIGTDRSALTDDNGKFEFFGLPSSTYTLQVQGIGYQQKKINNVKIIPGFITQVKFLLSTGVVALKDMEMNKEQLFAELPSSTSLSEIPLASYARPSLQYNRLTIEGKVFDERGRSIVGAVVLVLGTKRGAYSDNEGKFHIYGVPAGTYTLQARAGGYQVKDTTDVQVFSDFPVELNIPLDVEEER